MKNLWHWLTVIVAVVVSTSFATACHAQKVKQSTNYVSSTTPTIFFHGWGSSYRAEQQMTHYAKDHGVTNTIVRANVAKNGKVTWQGKIKRGTKNPIIEVNLANNKSTKLGEKSISDGYSKSSNYVFDVLTATQKKFGFTKVNIVAHSMGNLQVYYYLRNHGADPKLPQIQKIVDIAGHWNGLEAEKGANKVTLNPKTGEPSRQLPGYAGLITLRNTFPQQIKVLNIYGNLEDGSNSDGTVPTVSSKSLRWLLNNRAKSYQKLEIKGKMGQHSKLHENKQVDRALVKFIWEK